jgi:hypothetical protein
MPLWLEFIFVKKDVGSNKLRSQEPQKRAKADAMYVMLARLF